MTIKLKIMIRLFLVLICLWVMKVTAIAQTPFDPINPLWEDVPDEETEVWLNKSTDEWKDEFGAVVEDWNPVQMEFYKQVKVLALYDDEKQKLIELSLDDWVAKYGQMDVWKVEEMLFYAAVQDLKSNYTVISQQGGGKIISHDFDPINPLWEDLSEQETTVWLEKNDQDWQAVFGKNVEDWNPVQMEFYKQVKVLALYEEDKQKWMGKSLEDWQTEYGSMDNWSVMTMLFYAAVQDLKSGYYKDLESSTELVAEKSKFDPMNPLWEDLKPKAKKQWLGKEIKDWKKEFGDDVAEWNPIQMEFYKQVRVFALNQDNISKQKWMQKSVEDWIQEYGQMDKWQVEQMLFFSAVQDMKLGD